MINQSSAVLCFSIPNRLTNLAATNILASTKVVVVTMKTLSLRELCPLMLNIFPQNPQLMCRIWYQFMAESDSKHPLTFRKEIFFTSRSAESTDVQKYVPIVRRAGVTKRPRVKPASVPPLQFSNSFATELFVSRQSEVERKSRYARRRAFPLRVVCAMTKCTIQAYHTPTFPKQEMSSQTPGQRWTPHPQKKERKNWGGSHQSPTVQAGAPFSIIFAMEAACGKRKKRAQAGIQPNGIGHQPPIRLRLVVPTSQKTWPA